jgi:hypothetical protein
VQEISMEKFKLKWRWTDKNYCLLSQDELSEIRPLHADSAKEIWEKSLTFIDSKSEFSPNPELFESFETIDTIEPNVVASWLKGKIPSGNIIVSWQPDTAVITTANLFVKYWDEFCYPSSDDVSIWSESEKWVVHFWHYEKAVYGKAKNV